VVCAYTAVRGSDLRRNDVHLHLEGAFRQRDKLERADIPPKIREVEGAKEMEVNVPNFVNLQKPAGQSRVIVHTLNVTKVTNTFPQHPVY
jgi:hypothetical protein